MQGKGEEVMKFVDGQIASLMREGLSAETARVKIGLHCGGDRLVLKALDALADRMQARARPPLNAAPQDNRPRPAD